MTRYLAASEDTTTSAAAQPTVVPVVRRARFKNAAWSVATVIFATYVGWLIVGSLMI